MLDPFGHGVAPWVTFRRSVTAFTFALNHMTVGWDTRGWHMTNVRSTSPWWSSPGRSCASRSRGRGSHAPLNVALAAAGLFALHPLQTESVAYIVQRSESLASGLYLATLLLLLRRDEATEPWRRGGLLAGAVALHAIGLAAKPIVVTLPVAWLLHGAVVPAMREAGMPAWRRVWRRMPPALPLLALSAAAGFSTVAGFGFGTSISAGFETPELSATGYAATQLRVVPRYLRLLAWPAGQCADWYFRGVRGGGPCRACRPALDRNRVDRAHVTGHAAAA